MGRWGMEDLTERIINACINVLKTLGPEFVESIYRNALLIELRKQLLAYEAEKEIRISYCGEDVGLHKLDLLVEGEIVLELKSVEELHEKHYAQIRSYLKAMNKKVGLLVNFAGYKLDVRRVELG